MEIMRQDNMELRRLKRQQIERLEIQRDGVIDWIAIWGPLMVPLVPSGLTAVAIITHFPALLGIRIWAAVLIAVVTVIGLEVLGIVSIETWLDMRRYNQTLPESSEEEDAPALYAGLVVGLYAVVIVGLVFLLKIWPSLSIYSLLPLTMLGLITSWTIVLRKQHTERINARDAAALEQSEVDGLRQALDALRAQHDKALAKHRQEMTQLMSKLAQAQTEIDRLSASKRGGFDADHNQNPDNSDATFDANRQERQTNQRQLTDSRRRQVLRLLAQTASRDDANFAQWGRNLDAVSRQTIDGDVKWLQRQEYWLNGSDWKGASHFGGACKIVCK